MRNKVTVSGKLIRRELKYTPTGVPVFQGAIAGVRGLRRFVLPFEMVGEKAEAIAVALDGQKNPALFMRGHFLTKQWENETGEKRSRLILRADGFSPVLGEAKTLALPTRKGGALEFLEGAVNLAVLEGRLVRNISPKVVQMRKDGKDVVLSEGTVAVNMRFVGRDGEERELAAFVPFEFWDTRLEGKKGEWVQVAGVVSHSIWTTKTGETRSRFYVAAESFVRLGFIDLKATTPKADGPEVVEFPPVEDLPF